jgi:cytoskeletal protein CcmA (bactofilin family)
MLTIGFNVKINGDIDTEEDVLVIGRVSGTISSPKVTIDPRAEVTGRIVSKHADIKGFVSADVFAERLVLGETSTVHGRLFHRALDLQKGAYFEGQSRRHADPLTLGRRSAA